MSHQRLTQHCRKSDKGLNPAALSGEPPSDRHSKLGRHSRISKEDIISAAAGCFYANGYVETTLGHVAQRLDVTDKAFYHYFPNKDALYLETVMACMGWVTAVIHAVDEGGDDGFAKIKTFARVIIRGSNKRRPFLKCLPDHLVNTELGQQIRATDRLHEETLVGWVQDGMADGSIAPGNAQLVWKWNQGALIWLDTWARDGSCYSCDALEEAAMTMLDRSLAGRCGH